MSVTFTTHLNGESADATDYVNGITTIAIFLLANSDNQVIASLLSQVGEDEKAFINAAMAGLEERLKEK